MASIVYNDNSLDLFRNSRIEVAHLGLLSKSEQALRGTLIRNVGNKKWNTGKPIKNFNGNLKMKKARLQFMVV